MKRTYTIPDLKFADSVIAFAGYHGYQEQITDAQGNIIANPMTKVQFFDQCMKNYIVGITSIYFSGIAAQAASEAKAAEITNGFTIT